MKINAYILCYNEEKMIRHTLNHYSGFCSKITLMDNCSNDKTHDIVKKYFPEVKIHQYDSGGEIRDDIYLDLKNNCWKGSTADYVIVCDTDEFLYHPGGPLDALQKCKNNDVTLPMVEGYNMYSEIFPADYTKPIYEQVKMGVPSSGISGFTKQIVFDPKEVDEINYGPGCHTCSPAGNIRRLHREDCNFNLLHYHWLGRDHVKTKYRKYAQRLSQNNIQQGFGEQYTKGDKFVDECFDLLHKHAVQIIQ